MKTMSYDIDRYNPAKQIQELQRNTESYHES